MVKQMSDFEIFEEEYYDFADFLALELSAKRRKDRDNKKLRMTIRRPMKFPSFSAIKKADFAVLKTKKANGKRIEKERAKFELY